MFVGLPELFLQLEYLALGLVQLNGLWINILRWYVGDEASSGSIVERRDVFLDEPVAWR